MEWFGHLGIKAVQCLEMQKQKRCIQYRILTDLNFDASAGNVMFVIDYVVSSHKFLPQRCFNEVCIITIYIELVSIQFVQIF